MVIPIEESLIYVRPLYLRASGGRIPELTRVIVAYENRIVMEETLEEGLARLFSTGGARPAPPAETRAPATPAPHCSAAADRGGDAGLSALAAEAQRHYERAVQAQRAGDWATYGEELRQLGQVLDRMRARSRGGCALKLTIEYAGTRYSGWQIQKNAKTVQGEIERAITAATGERDFELYGSGRTDAGVHALAQVAHLDIHSTLPPETLRRRINDELPADINILLAEKVRHKFHARHDAIGRTYIYQVSRRRTAFAKPFVWWVKEDLDLARMREAARAVRRLPRFQIVLRCRSARGFDRGAARSARGPRRRRPDRLPRRRLALHLEAGPPAGRRDRRGRSWRTDAGRGDRDAVVGSGAPARLTAPASGLFLASVRYQGDRPDQGRLLLGGVTPFSRR